jgi:hypothetical protein
VASLASAASAARGTQQADERMAGCKQMNTKGTHTNRHECAACDRSQSLFDTIIDRTQRTSVGGGPHLLAAQEHQPGGRDAADNAGVAHRDGRNAWPGIELADRGAPVLGCLIFVLMTRCSRVAPCAIPRRQIMKACIALHKAQHGCTVSLGYTGAFSLRSIPFDPAGRRKHSSWQRPPGTELC